MACGQRAYVEHSVAFVCRERAWLTEQAVGNWHHCVCVKRQFPDDKGRASAGKRALKKGVLIRDCSNYRGLSGDITGLRSDGARRMNACLRRWRR